MDTSTLVDNLFQRLSSSGLLVRGNDGQTPTGVAEVSAAIEKIELDPAAPPFSDLIQAQAPPYSASLLSGLTAPLLWYNYEYTEAFKAADDQGSKPMGERTLAAAIFENAVVRGGCVWDADSNLRTLGNVPATRRLNRMNPGSQYAQQLPFGGAGGFVYSAPTGLNNHPFYNPLFLPRTVNAQATTKAEVQAFLKEIARHRQQWVARLLEQAQTGEQFANYLDQLYPTGLESEILIEPKTQEGDVYGELRFRGQQFLGLAFITDGRAHGAHSLVEYERSAEAFFEQATGEGGWIHGCASDYPLISITGVSLPDVPISGTSTTQGNIGAQWYRYLRDPEFGYTSLARENFSLIAR